MVLGDAGCRGLVLLHTGNAFHQDRERCFCGTIRGIKACLACTMGLLPIRRSGYSRRSCRYRDRPWKLTENDVIVLPHKYLDEIRRLPVSQANSMQANLDNMQSKFIHLDVLNTTRLFVTILKRKLNPQLSILIPTVWKELDAAFAKELPASINEEEWTSVVAFETLRRIVGRVSARIFGGKELRDDDNWLHTAEGYLNNR